MFLNFLGNRVPTLWRDYSGLRSDFFKGLDILGGVTSDYTNAPINVYSSDEGIIATAIVPGFSSEDIEVTVEDNLLYIKGKLKKDEREGFEMIRGEIGEKDFSRKLELPFAVDSEKVEAKFNFGILTIKLPKQESSKPKKVQVKVES